MTIRCTLAGLLTKPFAYHRPSTEIKRKGANDFAPFLSIQTLLKVKKIFSVVNSKVFGKLLHFRIFDGVFTWKVSG